MVIVNRNVYRLTDRRTIAKCFLKRIDLSVFFFLLLGRSLLMNDDDGGGREFSTRGCFLLAGIRPRVICNLLVRVEFSLYKG